MILVNNLMVNYKMVYLYKVYINLMVDNIMVNLKMDYMMVMVK